VSGAALPSGRAMTRDDRDVAAFDARAEGYEGGWLGLLHQQIAGRTADLALSAAPAPQRILDVGCGTGYLLRQLADRCPDAAELIGVDPARGMIAAARAAAAGDRLQWLEGTAEELPFPEGSFDLVVSTTSFDHWADQQAGLRECARVLTPGGRLVLADLFSPLLVPTLVGGRRRKARTRRRADRLLAAAGFRGVQWHDVEAVIIRAVTARR
jgi:ubiquinone/menaquinone biosynthesis C-methylase UbiE